MYHNIARNALILGRFVCILGHNRRARVLVFCARICYNQRVMTNYYSANEYFKRRFGGKVYKLALDGGMTCPNRDGTIDTRGCIFCAGGSGEFACPTCDSLDAQLSKAKSLVDKKTDAHKFIAYFQSYTNTYASADHLEKLFTPVILRPEICALSVATRPDCLPDDVIVLLSRLNQIKPVFVELGLQTIHPETAEYIRRGYELSVFDDAVKRLKNIGVNVIVHLIIGLPGENEEMVLDSLNYAVNTGADGVKLQLLHVLDGTDLAHDFRLGKVPVLTLENYARIVARCIQALPEHVVVHRITGDAPKRLLLAPEWSADKKRVLNYLNNYFLTHNIHQAKSLPENI